MVAACSAIGASEVLHGIGQIGVRIEQALRGAGAVFYTHLRAHETVLDLVCRLLLEKKNKTSCINRRMNRHIHN